MKETIEYCKSNYNEWCPGRITPTPRFPVMAIIAIDQEFGDDLDVDDSEALESIVEDYGKHVPICGVSYDGSGGYTVISPFSSIVEGNSLFIKWARVISWRYLSYEEAGAKWDALEREAGE